MAKGYDPLSIAPRADAAALPSGGDVASTFSRAVLRFAIGAKGHGSELIGNAHALQWNAAFLPAHRLEGTMADIRESMEELNRLHRELEQAYAAKQPAEKR